MISGSAGLLFDNHTPVDSPRFCQKLHKVTDTTRQAGHLTAQATDAKSVIPIFFWIYSRLRGATRCTKRDFNRQEKWAHKNFTTFNNEKHEVLHLGRNTRYQHMPAVTGCKAALQRKTRILAVLVDKKLNISHQRPALPAGQGR